METHQLLSQYNEITPSFNINNKYEFVQLELDERETISKNRNAVFEFKHQTMTKRYVSSLTPYSRLLLFHDMGTGKTCSAIAVAEQLKYEM